MRRYEVKGPCPELRLVLSKLAAEISPGESAVVVSKWLYVLEDVKNAAGLLGLGEVTGREPEAVQEIRRDMQVIGLTDSTEGGGSSHRDWPLKMSVVVYVGESVAEVLGVGGQVRWRP